MKFHHLITPNSIAVELTPIVCVEFSKYNFWEFAFTLHRAWKGFVEIRIQILWWQVNIRIL
jgi:hypothetical protein